MKVIENIKNEIEFNFDTVTDGDRENANLFLNKVDPFSLKADNISKYSNEGFDEIYGLLFNQVYFYIINENNKLRVSFKYSDEDEGNISIHRDVGEVYTSEEIDDEMESIKEGLEIFAYDELWKELPQEIYPNDIKGECSIEQINYSIGVFFLGLFIEKTEGNADEALYKEHLEMLIYSYVYDVSIDINSKELITVKYKGDKKEVNLKQLENIMVPNEIDFLPDNLMSKIEESFEIEGKGFVVGAVNIAQSSVFSKMMLKYKEEMEIDT